MDNPSILRLNWRSLVVPGSSIAACATFVRYKRARFPRINSQDFVVAAIRPDARVVFFNLPIMNERIIATLEPFHSLTSMSIKDLPSLADAFYWPDCEGLWLRYHGRDLLADNSARQHIPALLDRFRHKRLLDWRIMNWSDRDMSLVKPFTENDGVPVVIGVSSSGVAIYRSFPNQRGRLRSENCRHFIGSSCVSSAVLQSFLSLPDATEVANVFRSLRWHLYRCIVEEQSLPF